MKIFVAGATGAMGLPLVRALLTAGHEVTGMTRRGKGSDRLREVGAQVSFADAFDTAQVRSAIEQAEPDAVVDQLTWLPADPADLMSSMPDDTRLHRDGGGNLLTAAEALGVARYVMQSRGFYLESPPGMLADETARLRMDAPGVVADSNQVMADYERRVMTSTSLAGTVLRYGFFYGPGTWYRPDGAAADLVRDGASPVIGDGDGVWSFVHVDDAVAATLAALTAEPDTYNIVDDQPLPVSSWLPAFARWVDAPEPPRMTIDEALAAAGPEAVWYHTALTGASNERAKAQLGFNPRRLLWAPRH